MREIKRLKERKQCLTCHKKSYYISQNGNCKNCMAEKILFARAQMRNKEGLIYEKWKTNIIKSLNKL